VKNKVNETNLRSQKATMVERIYIFFNFNLDIVIPKKGFHFIKIKKINSF